MKLLNHLFEKLSGMYAPKQAAAVFTPAIISRHFSALF